MTYQEIKDRLSKCEYTLKCIQDGTLKEKGTKTIKKLELLKESLQTQLLEQEKGMVVTKDSEEAEKLAKKGVNVKLTTEAPGDYHYVKVARRDYKKAIGIIMKELGGDYVELNDPDTIYFKNLDQATLVDAVMDLQANDIDILDTSIDVFDGEDTDYTKRRKKGDDYYEDPDYYKEGTDINDPVLMKLRALQSKIAKKKQQKPVSSKHSAILSKLKAKRAQVMRDMEQEAEPEGGPIADKYGDMLNKIDAAIAKIKGTNEGYADYEPGTIAPKDLYYSDKHGKLVAMDDVDDKYHDRLELVYRKGDEIEGPMDEDQADQLSQEHLKIIASKAGKAVVKAVHDSGDEVARAKIKDVYTSALSGNSSPEAFTVHIIYKNDSEVSYRFQIMNSALYFLDGNNDVKISDVDVKPSGEPYINVDLVRNEMTKYFKQMREMTDQEFADAQEADRLANHPEKDKLIAIQNLIAKEKGLKEVDLEEYSSGPWTKHKLLAYLGQADDAMIRTHDDKYLIIYNPKSGNDDNAKMWNDDSVFAVDQDGEEHEVRYDNIDGLQLENSELDKITKAKRLIKQQAPAMNKLPQDDPKRKAFIDRVKQINKKHKELLDKEDDKISGIGKDQELDEKRIRVKKEGLNADFAPSPNSDVMDANAEEYDVATAFKKARVDMSKPVMVIHSYGHAQYAKDVKDEMSAEAAIKKLEAERQERSKQYTDDGEEVPEDHHGYEFENYSVLEEEMPEGHEYKLAYFQTGDADYAITQEKSVNELDEGRGDMDMIKGIIKDRANESGFSEREEAAEVIGGIADEYMISLESLKDYIDEGESDLHENKLNEATDLYDRNGIQITRFAGGRGRGLMLQINIGGKYIVVPADEFNNFIRALASIKDDVRDMKLQQPRDRYEQSETK